MGNVTHIPAANPSHLRARSLQQVASVYGSSTMMALFCFGGWLKSHADVCIAVISSGC